MRVNRNKGKCLFGEDERHPDVHAAVAASYCLRLSAPETKETILMKYVSLHLNAIKTESNLMLKHKYKKETQEEMKSERESPLEKNNKDIPLPCASRYLLLLGEHQFCMRQPPHRPQGILWGAVSGCRKNSQLWHPVLPLSSPVLPLSSPAVPRLCRAHTGSPSTATPEQTQSRSEMALPWLLKTQAVYNCILKGILEIYSLKWGSAERLTAALI